MAERYDPLASVQAAGPPGTVSFIYGLPDPDTFPARELQEAADQVLHERPDLALQYGPEQGYGPLIDYLRARLAREEGLAIERPQIMLTGGSTQAIDHLCTLFSRRGDVVLVGAPTYHEMVRLFRDHGLQPLQVPMDDAGWQVEALADRLKELDRRGQRPRFLYLIPSFQNPSGITLAAERRKPLLELAQRYEISIIEDDVYRDLAFEGVVPASLFARSGAARVLRIGSFSKILAPGVRMGWVLGPVDLIERLISSGMRTSSGGANPLIANVLAAFCQKGLLEPHILRLRQAYRQRRDAALTALEAHMPKGVGWTQPGGGFFIWLTLPQPLRAKEVARQASAEGLLIPAGDPFFAEAPTGQHLRLAFSYVTQEKIDEGVRTLAQVIHRAL